MVAHLFSKLPPPFSVSSNLAPLPFSLTLSSLLIVLDALSFFLPRVKARLGCWKAVYPLARYTTHLRFSPSSLLHCFDATFFSSVLFLSGPPSCGRVTFVYQECISNNLVSPVCVKGSRPTWLDFSLDITCLRVLRIILIWIQMNSNQ